jgi:hypothetical protein
MKRLNLIELEDQVWFPTSIRDAITDYLQFVFTFFHVYRCVLPRLQSILNKLRENQIVDLCSGSGGPWLNLYKFVQEPMPRIICLTDKFPNARSFEYVRSASKELIVFRRDPIDVTAVPPELCGFRTLFSSFHHFSPPQARAILAAACDTSLCVLICTIHPPVPVVAANMDVLCSDCSRGGAIRWVSILFPHLHSRRVEVVHLGILTV